MTLKLAWRNLFRNKRRTFIAGTAIGIGLAAMIFVDALWEGMEENMIRTVTATFTGEAQIHTEGFRETQEVERTIKQQERIIAGLKKEPAVERFTLRAMSPGMISSPANLNAVLLVGVQTETEREISRIDEAIVRGKFFAGDDPQNMLIGSKLAELLDVDVGDRVVITVAQAETGDLSQEMFRISGIYQFNTDEMDKGMAFVRLEKAQEMLNIDKAVHEIAIDFTNREFARDEQNPFWAEYSEGGNEALGWPGLFPQLRAMFEWSQYTILIISVILFAIIALGIVNTLFMALYERMFEFGVLRAIGTRPFGIWKMIVSEAGSLAILSIGLGMVLGFVITSVFARIGIDYRGIEMGGMTVQDLIYPVLYVRQFIVYPLWVLLFTIIVGIYPATYAARLKPADAIRKSL
jgi:ABC-type lipoprotein release transport system permease subunit